MIAFSHCEFAVVNAVCKGQNSRHKHAKWGYNAKEKRFATSEKTAYPMGLAKMFASCSVIAFLSKGIAALPATLEDIKDTSLQSLRQMRASTAMQPKATRIPALVPTFSTKVRLRGHPHSLPHFKILISQAISAQRRKIAFHSPRRFWNWGWWWWRLGVVDGKNPQAKTIFALRMRTLPFGSVKSARSFLCVSHSLWAILVKEFMVAWTNYFDDFVIFAKANEVASVAGSLKFVFKALGWLFAEDGDKAPDFSHSANALGVQIDVQNMHSGVVTIDNTAGRKGDLVQILDDVIVSKKLWDCAESCSLLQVSSQVVSPWSPSMWLRVMLIACVAWTLPNLQLMRWDCAELSFQRAPPELSMSQRLECGLSSQTHVLTPRLSLELELYLWTAMGSCNTSSLKRFIMKSSRWSMWHQGRLRSLNLSFSQSSAPSKCGGMSSEELNLLSRLTMMWFETRDRMSDKQCEWWTYTWSLFGDRVWAWREPLDESCSHRFK